MPTRFQAFEPEHAEAMGQAFRAAWESLADQGNLTGAEADTAREALALRIIDVAKSGERDVTRLRDDALAYLANAKIAKRA